MVEENFDLSRVIPSAVASYSTISPRSFHNVIIPLEDIVIELQSQSGNDSKVPGETESQVVQS
ncbi:MAG: hypothetical protein R2744_05000 [Bacteroidales bacterium]